MATCQCRTEDGSSTTTTNNTGNSDEVEMRVPPRRRCPAVISRLRVEKIEGGLVVAGVVVAASCQIALPAFGCLFMLVGAVLTAASYRGPSQNEGQDEYEARLAFTGNSRILGPACIVVGGLMLAAGIALCLLARRARREERRVGFHCPIHGDFYPPAGLSPNGVTCTKSQQRNFLSLPSVFSFCRGQSGRFKGYGRGQPTCPHSTLSSTRSSLSSSFPQEASTSPATVSRCPTPMPFLVTSTSSSGLIAPLRLSPEQTFGSIKSLSVSREVASFPQSRTPSPPPTTDRQMAPTTVLPPLPAPDDTDGRPNRIPLQPYTSPLPPIGCEREPQMVAPAEECQDSPPPPQRPDGPKKSVSIVLPDEDKG